MRNRKIYFLICGFSLMAASCSASEFDNPEPDERQMEIAMSKKREEEYKKFYGDDSGKPADKGDLPKKLAEIKDQARLNKVYWGGIHVGDLIVEVKKEGEYYNFEVIMRSYNIAKLISKFSSETEGKIKITDDGFLPSYYKTHYKRRKDDRNIELKFSDDGQTIISDINTPPEKRWKRKEVPAELKIGVQDPLSIAFVARQMIIDRLESGEKEFSIPLYDGRRRSKYNFKIKGKTKDGLIEVGFAEEAVAGYTDNELKEFKKGNKEITLYLSPLDYWPVKAKGRSPLGNATASLDKICDTLEKCLD